MVLFYLLVCQSCYVPSYHSDQLTWESLFKGGNHMRLCIPELASMQIFVLCWYEQEFCVFDQRFVYGACKWMFHYPHPEWKGFEG